MTPLFADAPDHLPVPQPCAEVREGCPSTQAWLADLDGDGDLDALIAQGGGADGEEWGPTLWENRDGVLVDAGGLPGAVVSALGAKALRIGRQIDPGVPWTSALGGTPLSLALKSGNFGGRDFFAKAIAEAP